MCHPVVAKLFSCADQTGFLGRHIFHLLCIEQYRAVCRSGPLATGNRLEPLSGRPDVHRAGGFDIWTHQRRGPVMIIQFFSGCIFFGFMIVAGHFLKYWKTTNDSFFLWFAMAFALFGLERFCIALFIGDTTISYIYILRLVASCFIIIAFIQKNRNKKRND